jgi:transglutaminase-like putative cysteine protease
MLMIAALLAPYDHACARITRDAGIDPTVVIERHVQHYVVEPDGTYRLTVDDARTIAGQRAVRESGRFAIHYGAALDEIASVEACTHKPDGRRVPVPPDGIREDVAGDTPSGARTRTVVFRDVAIGDQLVVHYVVRRHTPAFPAQFEDLAVMPPQVHRNTMVVYDMPASMPLHADAIGFVPVPGDSPPGRRRYQWRYQGSQAGGGNGRVEADAVSVVDDGRRLAVSTFPDYPGLAAALRAATAGKALPSPAVLALAHQLTAGLPDTDTRARVLALTDWVRSQIRHVDARDSAGVVPHPADTVLAMRRGDDKDHAVLLEALLAAVGIAGTPALVNGTTAYTLPEAPVLDVLDHELVYVPALDLFLDPAAPSFRAGYLPPALLGKPALLLKTGTFAMTPVVQPQKVHSVVTVDVGRDGRGSFAGYQAVSGALAESLRTLAHADVAAGRERGTDHVPHKVVRHESGMHKGAADDTAAVDTPLAGSADGNDVYRLTLSGTSAEPGDLRPGATFALSDRAWSPVTAAVMDLLHERERHHDFVCPAIDAEDEIRVRPPQGLRFAALPRPASVIVGGIFYQATYAREGNAVLVRRRLTFRHGRATCTPADARAMLPALDRIRRNLLGRIAFTAGRPGATSGMVVARKRIAPPARVQRGHGLVREVEAQVDAVAPGAIAGRPAGDLDEAAAPEEAGRVRMRIDRHIAGPQLASGHVQQAVGQQGTADASAVAISPHEAEHEGAEIVELGQFITAKADDAAVVHDDEQGAVRVVQRRTQP